MTDKAKGQDISIGIVTEALPDALFRVKFQNQEKEILAYLSGKMRLNRIKVLIGDSVEVVLDSYGGRGRIVRRLDNRRENALQIIPKTMKVKASIKKMCSKCKLVRREGVLFVVCKSNPKHKQTQGQICEYLKI